MTDQFYFTTLAGLALSVAGFAGLVTALRRDSRWSRTELWRLRNIVRSSLTIVVFGLIPQPIYRAVGGDEQLTIRIVSALLVVAFADSIRRAFAERHQWGAGHARSAVVIVGAQLVVQLANVLVASLPLLLFGLMLWLIFPMQLFLRVIRDFQPPTEDG
ncbi:MAG: hypothetical protein M3O99_03325 [Chloroflexota bacterium]|nr:hypothetical protein [Chloroflexota bacterium]